MSSEHNLHTCCGQKPRVRADGGKLVEQPHECQRDENKGVDWDKVKQEQERATKARV